MNVGVRNRNEQHCPVCEQVLNDDERTIEAREVLFVGAAAYAWCPECSRQVPGPWGAAYKVRWAEAFARACARLRVQASDRKSLWRLQNETGTVVELALTASESDYVLHYMQNGEEQTTERFRSRESALFRADELRHRLREQGFERRDGRPHPGNKADMRPTDLWTVTDPDGRRVRATLIPIGEMVTLAWFVDDRLEGAEDFADWDAAMRRAAELRMAVSARISSAPRRS